MKKYISFFIIVAVVSLLTACFSPWTGDSSITINLGRNTGRYYLSKEEDIEGFEYTITLRGPGGILTKQVKESGPVTFQVVPGNWTVDVRAIGDNPWWYSGTGRPTDAPESIRTRERMLRALGLEANIEVKAGANKAVALEMESAMEVSGWDELRWFVMNTNFSGGKEIIVFNADTKEIVVEETMNMFNIDTGAPQKIDLTIISDGDIILKRSPERDGSEGLVFPDSFFNISNNAALTLGKPGMTGTITLDGGWKDDLIASAPLISVYFDGTLEMNEGINLIKNFNDSDFPAGGVYVGEGNFTMNGGAISDNQALFGGGVYIVHDTGWDEGDGSLIMSGSAEISGNSALYFGGGVYVEGGTLTMEGGTINSNETAGDGGGVYDVNGILNMGGNAVISDNIAHNGGGLYLVEGEAQMKGSTVIKGNKADDGNGGGVFIENSIFEMSGGSIEGNECLAITGGRNGCGGGVYNDKGIFTMSGGSITKNRIPPYGHGAGLCTTTNLNEVDKSLITGNLMGDDIAPDNEQFHIIAFG